MTEINEQQTSFKGKFGPLEDEITIQKYLEKYNALETVKGAYKKVYCSLNV
jgi:hypothetical protein